MTYRVDISIDPESGWWVAEVSGNGVAGVTQGKSLGQVRSRARAALAAALDDDAAAEAAELDEHLDIGSLSGVVGPLLGLRKAAQDAQDAYASSLRNAAVELAENGWSVRDSAAVLGVSFQRVQQLLAG